MIRRWERSIAVRNNMRTTAISFALFSLSLATLSLALLAFSQESQPLDIPNLIRLLLASTGTVFFLSAALMLDWAIDIFSKEEWDELDKIAESIGEPKRKQGARGFYERVGLFGGGYVLLSLSIGILTFVTLSLFSSPVKLAPLILAILCGGAIFVKMMTQNLLGVLSSIGVIGTLAGASISLSYFTSLEGNVLAIRITGITAELLLVSIIGVHWWKSSRVKDKRSSSIL